MTSVLLPALQGQLGSWTYYATLMKLSDVESRVSYAREIHKNSRLSDMIQRRLDDKTRAADIEHYLLQTKDRFFNSLVVGVYGGTPQWHPFEVSLRHKSHSLTNLPDGDRDVIGYLELDGHERLFALDGQHRLAGSANAGVFGGMMALPTLASKCHMRAGGKVSINEAVTPVVVRNVVGKKYVFVLDARRGRTGWYLVRDGWSPLKLTKSRQRRCSPAGKCRDIFAFRAVSDQSAS